MLEGLQPQRTKAEYCKIQITLAELEPTDRDILAAALENTRDWPANTLSTQLRLKGLSLADVTIAKHRKRACACYRELG